MCQLRHQCLESFPELGCSKAADASDLSTLVLQLLPRENFTAEVWESIAQFAQWCTSRFPSECFIVRQRVSTAEKVNRKIQQNGLRAWFDMVGFQIVPRSMTQFLKIIRVLHNEAQWDRVFVFNTFPFSQADFIRLVGRNSSSYYRAIHYYFNLGRVCVEVQVRMPLTDQWSMLHHATCYKPIQQVTAEEERAVSAFGHTANWVDFYQLSLAN